MFGASLTVRIHVSNLDRVELELLFHMLGNELIARQGEESSLLDHAVAIDLGQGTIEISVTTVGRTEPEAQALADFYIEEVLRATGGEYTGDESVRPDWTQASESFAGTGIVVTAREPVAV